MGRIETGVRALVACAALALAVGCSGGISLAGDGGDDARPSTDDGEDGTCPPEALARGRCSTEDATCRMPVACQPCAREVWTWFATDCWCSGGSWRCSHPDCFPPYGPGNYSDPACTVPWGADGDADADGDGAFDGDVGIEAEVEDGEAVDDGDADASVGPCVDGWFDAVSALCWQNPADNTERDWDHSLAYCDGLVMGESDGWRMPTISELRSLIRGCPGTETTGACGVADSCLDTGCFNDACVGCPSFRGPGGYGAYWPLELLGDTEISWSSATFANEGLFVGWGVWVARFSTGRVGYFSKASLALVRCVRPGP